jgi:hypothetical protein
MAVGLAERLEQKRTDDTLRRVVELTSRVKSHDLICLVATRGTGVIGATPESAGVGEGVGVGGRCGWQIDVVDAARRKDEATLGAVLLFAAQHQGWVIWRSDADRDLAGVELERDELQRLRSHRRAVGMLSRLERCQTDLPGNLAALLPAINTTTISAAVAARQRAAVIGRLNELMEVVETYGFVSIWHGPRGNVSAHGVVDVASAVLENDSALLGAIMVLAAHDKELVIWWHESERELPVGVRQIAEPLLPHRPAIVLHSKLQLCGGGGGGCGGEGGLSQADGLPPAPWDFDHSVELDRLSSRLTERASVATSSRVEQYKSRLIESGQIFLTADAGGGGGGGGVAPVGEEVDVGALIAANDRPSLQALVELRDSDADWVVWAWAADWEAIHDVQREGGVHPATLQVCRRLASLPTPMPRSDGGGAEESTASGSRVELRRCSFRWTGNARNVAVSGSFNDWATLPMQRVGPREFSVDLDLKRTQHEYTYVAVLPYHLATRFRPAPYGTASCIRGWW